jgi:hypothetical protein
MNSSLSNSDRETVIAKVIPKTKEELLVERITNVRTAIFYTRQSIMHHLEDMNTMDAELRSIEAELSILWNL